MQEERAAAAGEWWWESNCGFGSAAMARLLWGRGRGARSVGGPVAPIRTQGFSLCLGAIRGRAGSANQDARNYPPSTSSFSLRGQKSFAGA
jgi:hypothetical protein